MDNAKEFLYDHLPLLKQGDQGVIQNNWYDKETEEVISPEMTTHCDACGADEQFRYLRMARVFEAGKTTNLIHFVCAECYVQLYKPVDKELYAVSDEEWERFVEGKRAMMELKEPGID